jgi:hypothetical protein
MFLGLSLSQFVVFHVVISLLAIVSGVAMLSAMIAGRRAAGLMAFFLVTTAATSITGFMFPIRQIGVGHVFGAMSLVVLVPTMAARYRYGLAGLWGWVHALGVASLLYLNAFIAIRQAFAKSVALHELGPSLPPLVQALVLVLCAMAGLFAASNVERPHAKPVRTIARRPAYGGWMSAH